MSCPVLSCDVMWCASCHVPSDHLFELNYSITLYNHGDMDQSHVHFKEFKTLWEELEEEVKNAVSGTHHSKQTASERRGHGRGGGRSALLICSCVLLCYCVGSRCAGTNERAVQSVILVQHCV